MAEDHDLFGLNLRPVRSQLRAIERQIEDEKPLDEIELKQADIELEPLIDQAMAALAFLEELPGVTTDPALTQDGNQAEPTKTDACLAMRVTFAEKRYFQILTTYNGKELPNVVKPFCSELRALERQIEDERTRDQTKHKQASRALRDLIEQAEAVISFFDTKRKKRRTAGFKTDRDQADGERKRKQYLCLAVRITLAEKRYFQILATQDGKKLTQFIRDAALS